MAEERELRRIDGERVAWPIRSLCVYCASSTGSSQRIIDGATSLGRLMAAERIELVYGGGSVGLMGVLAETSGKNIDQMVPRDNMFAWSFVDFILKEYPKRFGEVARLVKRRTPIGEVIKKGLGMSAFQFEEEWRTYVKTRYSKKATPFGKPVQRRNRK